MKARFVPILLAALAVAAAFAIGGCGGGGSSTDPASLAPQDTQVFIELDKPEGSAAAELESVVKKITGVSDVGSAIGEKLEESASSLGEHIDYDKEVKPWLGKNGGLVLNGYNGNDFTAATFMYETTDPGASQAFIEHVAKQTDEPVHDASYKGIDFKVQSDGGSTGLVGDYVVASAKESGFKEVVDASKGESLADVERYTKAIAEAPGDAIARVYADIGKLVEADGPPPDAETKEGLKILGIDWQSSTLVAGLVPGSDSVELDLSTDVLSEPPPSGDASDLLGSLPADSVAALASPETGKALAQLIGRIDREGIPSAGLQPHELKGAFAASGIDLDSLAKSGGDSAAFLEGETKSSLGGAYLLESSDPTEAKNAVSSIGLYLRSAAVPGVTALSGKLSGFTIRSADLGRMPLVIATGGKRVAIAYGLPAATKALAGGGKTLAADPRYKEAVASLGSTPISGFADGPAALRLAETLISSDQREGFLKAKPYLAKIEYLALGSEDTDQVSRAKLIVGVGK